MVEIAKSKKGESVLLIVSMSIAIIIGLFSFSLIFSSTEEPFKRSAEVAIQESSKRANISLGNISLEDYEFSGRPNDQCGNQRGISHQSGNFSGINSVTEKPYYPEYYECVGDDCCSSFVYKHILDMGKLLEEKLVSVDFYINKRFEVDESSRSCTAADCCDPLSANFNSSSGGITYCSYGPPYTVLFYASEHGRETEWRKVYGSNYSHPGKNQIVFPVGGKFQFIKVIIVNRGFIDYITAEVIPWHYSEMRHFDICNTSLPERKGKNYITTPAQPMRRLTNLEIGKGYMIKIEGNRSHEGLWKKG